MRASYTLCIAQKTFIICPTRHDEKMDGPEVQTTDGHECTHITGICGTFHDFRLEHRESTSRRTSIYRNGLPSVVPSASISPTDGSEEQIRDIA